MRRYVTLFEAPFEASVLSDHKNNALQVGSLLAIPPPPPGSQPLAGSMTVDLLGNSLTQWATHVQDVASGMILPPEAVVNCPQVDIVDVLNRLEGLTRVQYCRLCFGVGQKYRCSGIPHQAPSQAMDTLPAPTSENLLVTAGVGRGGRGQSQPRAPTTPGICQTRPTAPQQQTPTPGRQETNQATPYHQQVYPP